MAERSSSEPRSIDPGARALLDAAAGIFTDLRPSGVLRRVAGAACELTGAEHAVVAQLPREPAGQEPAQVVEHGRTVGYRRIGDLPSGPDTLRMPIRLHDTDFALLCVTGGRPFTDEDHELVTELARMAGTAIGNALRHEEALRRERWYEASQQVTAALLGGEDGTATLHTIAERARVVSGASAAGIALPATDEEPELVFEVIASPHEPYLRLAGTRIPLSGTASGLAYTSGEPVTVSAYGDHVRVQQADTDIDLPSTITNLDSAVAVPLVAGSAKLGVLVVVKFRGEEPFTTTDAALVDDFAAHAALALEFARAEEDRRRLVVFSERDRIARDLHDQVIQRLFAIGLGLEGLRRLTGRPELAERVSGFVLDLDRTIRDVRNSIFSLQEPEEAPGGLRSDLLRMAQDASGMLGFEPRIGFDGPIDATVTGPLRSDLLATVREALSNVARHAEAHTVAVEVFAARDGRQLRLTVTDDGIGMPESPHRRSGLANLQRRAARWHGELTVRRRAGGGTELVWTAVPGDAPSEGAGWP